MTAARGAFDRVLERGLERLIVEVDAVEFAPLALRFSWGWTRRTTVVRLGGGGVWGEGEDVTYDGPLQRRLSAGGGPDWRGLRGRWAWGEFVARAAALVGDPGSTRDGGWRAKRRWALESAGLALALNQAGIELTDLVGGRAAPVRYVVSPSLGAPPDLGRLAIDRSRNPAASFKLDWGPRWTGETLRALAATQAVEVIDFKSARPEGDRAAVSESFALRVAELLPGCWLEDPPPALWRAGAPPDVAGRIALDAPVESVEDLDRCGPAVGAVNVKPSRLGSVAALAGVVAGCATRGLEVYLGGQFELGPGRRQLQALAGMLCPDAPNDVAPASTYVRDPSERQGESGLDRPERLPVQRFAAGRG